MKQALVDLERSNQAARLRNDQVANEVRDLQEGLGMIEELARQDLGMVKPNEIFVQIAQPGR
jgi:cell division protein FtsB